MAIPRCLSRHVSVCPCLFFPVSSVSSVSPFSLPSLQEIEAALIFDNPHSEYTMEALRASWGQMLAAINRALNETQNQILIRDSKGLTEEQIAEYRKSFNHFDKVIIMD